MTNAKYNGSIKLKAMKHEALGDNLKATLLWAEASVLEAGHNGLTKETKALLKKTKTMIRILQSQRRHKMGSKALNKIIQTAKKTKLKYDMDENDQGDDCLNFDDSTIQVGGNTYYVYISYNCYETGSAENAIKWIKEWEENKIDIGEE